MPPAINLLQNASVTEEGAKEEARPVDAGIKVITPWGQYKLPQVTLKPGWYEFTVTGPSPLTLQLYEPEHFRLIELQATQDEPAYLRLSGGVYDPAVIAGGRPGIYAFEAASFQVLPQWRRFGLLAGRLLQALRQGMSLGRITALIRLALAKNKTYGLRAQAKVETDHLGPHARYDLAQREIRPDPSRYADRLAALVPGPVFLIEGHTPDGLDSQIYPHFTRDAAQAHDAVVVLGEGDRLTPDALMLFAEALAADPSKTLFLADKWVGDVPTAHVAWDPILYNGGLPTPYVYRAGAHQPLMRFDNQGDCAIVSVPVASTNMDEFYREFPRPMDMCANSQPACSIIIPTRDRADLLSACLAGLFENTPWPHEVIVVDNGSVQLETFALFKEYGGKGLRIIRADIDFNFSTLCNLGAEAAIYDYLVFLNNDVVLHQPDWLERLMELAIMPEAGAVGAKLLYGDGRLQHGGVMLGLTQLCGHLWRGAGTDEQGDEPRLKYSSLRSAVTGACLCVSKEKFKKVGAFDEVAFPVTLNDVDLCRKFEERGWYNIFSAKAVLYHLEGESRGDDDSAGKTFRRGLELLQFSQRWGVRGDLFFPVVFSRKTETCQFK
ncbi:glycosyltransferase family 2 protein [Asticcacaulis machinosus]|uniref:Glycosyltransferase family 2 protein n=1 Tax=Asticcacaulis machinosus TaxID=2984211 RepID=A0ABT5HK52_9CAUL|nr:glycosyltransferase family 2 protein [Asticcacaulis machinosus]MDC7676511.1 glycosyltransferase family 2 protein [Asticcacaulis machinosus]